MPSSCYHDVSLQKRQNVTWQRVRASWKSSTPQRNEIQQRCIESKAHCESCIRAVMQQPLSATLIFKCTSLFPPWMPSISIDQVKLNILFSVQISTIFSLCNVNNKHLDHGNTFPPPVWEVSSGYGNAVISGCSTVPPINVLYMTCSTQSSGQQETSRWT